MVVTVAVAVGEGVGVNLFESVSTPPVPMIGILPSFIFFIFILPTDIVWSPMSRSLAAFNTRTPLNSCTDIEKKVKKNVLEE